MAMAVLAVNNSPCSCRSCVGESVGHRCRPQHRRRIPVHGGPRGTRQTPVAPARVPAHRCAPRGYSLEHFVKQLGPPTIVRGTDTSGKFVQNIFVRRDYSILAVSRPDGEVAIFSVMSCDRSFAPTLSTPAGSTVRLQSVPLKEAEDLPEENFDSSYIEGRAYSYAPAVTGSGLDQLVEGYEGQSTASMNRGYYYGVNGACSDYKSALNVGSDILFFGSADQMPGAVASTRQRLAANFYAETYGLYDYALNDGGQLTGDGDDSLFLSPFRFDFPAQLLPLNGTRTF